MQSRDDIIKEFDKGSRERSLLVVLLDLRDLMLGLAREFSKSEERKTTKNSKEPNK